MEKGFDCRGKTKEEIRDAVGKVVLWKRKIKRQEARA